MSSSILDKLKIKPIPQVKQIIEIGIQKPQTQEAVHISTPITDKSSLGFDRSLFLQKIKNSKELQSQPSDISTSSLIIKPSTPDDIEQKKKVQTKTKKKATISETTISKTTISETEKTKDVSSSSVTPIVNLDTTIQEIQEKKPRLTLVPSKVQTGPAGMIKYGVEKPSDTLKESIASKSDILTVNASSYYLNNRDIFISFMSSLFEKYKKELIQESQKETSCKERSEEFSLMTHQKIVRDYLSLYTPYRGLLLYHGLGSGKTCSSIAIAEGLKSSKQIIVMTPASLRTNYLEELKKCGDVLYKKTQYWEFINTSNNEELIEPLAKVLSISVDYINKASGAWMINTKKSSNFDDLSSDEKTSLNKQINEMIRQKYQFIAYNGLRNTHLQVLTKDFTINPFDNSVVIIDEAHNFVSRIVNKIGKKKDSKKKDSLSLKLYEYLMTAQNVRIVLLSGTPIINYPNELGIMFNILRGKIKTWNLNLNIGDVGGKKITKEFLQKLLNNKNDLMDYIDYNPTLSVLTITRNPYGFINKSTDDIYKGVIIGERGELDDTQFIKLVTNILATNGIKIVPYGKKLIEYKALPDTIDEFKEYFIDVEINDVKNMNLLKRRILGLTSYFRSAQEGLMPKYEKSSDFIIVRIPMSSFQFNIYEEARVAERNQEKNRAKNKGKKSKKEDDIYDEVSSTYRIFSRLFCNFVFPQPTIMRPMPSDDSDLKETIKNISLDEDMIDLASNEDKLANVDGKYEADEIFNEEIGDDTIEGTKKVLSKKQRKTLYEKSIITALNQLEEKKEDYLKPEALQIYSPKFLNVLENIKDPNHSGLHLVYSQFRTLEGIGILKLILEANGFVQFKIMKEGESWNISIPEEDMDKPKFVLYTGTETTEEKEIVRNIYNGNWKFVPQEIKDKLEERAISNMNGEIIKVFMITASGAEGISLENVRFVHIVEPYWHPVRIEQVIGRARRICSHQHLPEELRTVKVFLYLMVLSEEQKKSDISIALRMNDKSKRDNSTPVTTDEALYEIATIKQEVSEKLLDAVKESSIDCALHTRIGSKEKIKCFTFGTSDPNSFSFKPYIGDEDSDETSEKNKKQVSWKGVDVALDGINYVYNRLTNELYDRDSYYRGEPIKIGELIISGNGSEKIYTLKKI